jgi:hypothetical protein
MLSSVAVAVIVTAVSQLDVHILKQNCEQIEIRPENIAYVV